MHWEEKGAYTGMISAPMLLEHGVTHAIVGHSEPRKYYSETDEQINLRARSAQEHGLIPILCVGESLDQREARETERVIHRQVEQGLEGLDPLRVIVAYEPIWAIGTGKTCASLEANRICGLIRGWVGNPDVVVQYGGSVNPGTIDELMAQSDIDGVLVGGLPRSGELRPHRRLSGAGGGLKGPSDARGESPRADASGGGARAGLSRPWRPVARGAWGHAGSQVNGAAGAGGGAGNGCTEANAIGTLGAMGARAQSAERPRPGDGDPEPHPRFLQ